MDAVLLADRIRNLDEMECVVREPLCCPNLIYIKAFWVVVTCSGSWSNQLCCEVFGSGAAEGCE